MAPQAGQKCEQHHYGEDRVRQKAHRDVVTYAGETVWRLTPRAELPHPNRRQNRRERCWAYHRRRAGLLLKRRLRRPSGMAEPSRMGSTGPATRHVA